MANPTQSYTVSGQKAKHNTRDPDIPERPAAFNPRNASVCLGLKALTHLALPPFRDSLYLLNPSGVVFGPHAQLDVSGSFHVSTADVIHFSDGATYSANLAENSSLTVASPVAFGFLDSHPARIEIQGSQLSGQEGKTFSVTGGDITMTASQEAMGQSPSLVAPGGRIPHQCCFPWRCAG